MSLRSTSRRQTKPHARQRMVDMSERRPDREQLIENPIAVLRRLPAMGRVMLTASHGGATHERMGMVEHVTEAGGKALCGGAAHDSAIDLSAVQAVFVDRTGKMKDKVVPRLEFHDVGGKAMFSFVGLDGLEPFDAGLVGATTTPVTASTREPSEPATLNEADPGSAPFDAACKAGAAVTIAFSRPGLTQSWNGVIEKVTLAMGFINVMRPDFHLHLRGGAVARWRRNDGGGTVEMIAEDADGRATGLTVRGPREAFG
jgi:putative heme degradation protein